MATELQQLTDEETQALSDEGVRERVAEISRAINNPSIDERLDALEARASELKTMLSRLLSELDEAGE